MAAAARLVGDYALWFSNLGGPEVPLEAALQMLLEAFRLPQVQLQLVCLAYAAHFKQCDAQSDTPPTSMRHCAFVHVKKLTYPLKCFAYVGLGSLCCSVCPHGCCCLSKAVTKVKMLSYSYLAPIAVMVFGWEYIVSLHQLAGVVLAQDWQRVAWLSLLLLVFLLSVKASCCLQAMPMAATVLCGLSAKSCLFLQAVPAAAKALRGLCIRCAARLSNPTTVGALINRAHTALQTSATRSDAASGMYTRTCSAWESEMFA